MAEVRAVRDRGDLVGVHRDIGESGSAAGGEPLTETVPVVEQLDAVAVSRHDRLQVTALGVDGRHRDESANRVPVE